MTSKELTEAIEKDRNEGYSVRHICDQYKISRYRYYQIWNKLKKQAREQTTTVSQKPAEIKPLDFSTKITPEFRLKFLQEAQKGDKKISSICQKNNISRPTYYKWLERFKEDEIHPEASLSNKYLKEDKHWKHIPEYKVQQLLDLIMEHPEYSVHRLQKELSIIGHHGIQNILERKGLSNFADRITYRQLHKKEEVLPVPATGHFIPIFDLALRLYRMIIAPFVTIPKIFNSILRTYPYLSFGFATFLFSFLFSLYWINVFSKTQTLSDTLGYLFASAALTIGSFFFLYSLKYYFTVALVLGFSRQSLEGEGNEVQSSIRQLADKAQSETEEINNQPGSFLDTLLDRVLGREGRRNNGNGGGTKITAGGLQPDLSKVTLSRQPFVSIHLASYNEKRVIDRLLTAATSMDYPNNSYEVILVDDSNDPEAISVVNQWKGYPNLKIIQRTERSGFKGGALEEARKVTDQRAEFVLVFDADFIPYPDTITQFLKYFKAVGGWKEDTKILGEGNRLVSQYPNIPVSSKIAAIQGYQWHVLNKSENWITRGVRSEYAGSYVVERSGTEIYGGLKQIAGSVYMIKREILDSIGWGVSITEDFELTLKLYEKGYKVVYTPYLQAPSECVSTLQRLIRQRMRWAEGHSHNIRKMFKKLLFGSFADVGNDQFPNPNFQTNSPPEADQPLAENDQNSKLIENLNIGKFNENCIPIKSGENSRKWNPSPLTLSEKLEFLYLSPYYLQSALFILGTLSWFASEVIFKVRLPFWTAVWGWSLVLTNLLSLPLLNMVGLFLEESEERDYLGLFAFILLSYTLAPFQAYASVKGFFEKEEGPWFRTPKTGRITDIFERGKFYRFISGIIPWRTPALAQSMAKWSNDRGVLWRINSSDNLPARNAFGIADAGGSSPIHNLPSINPYLSLATANSRFNTFKIRPKQIRWVGKLALVILLSISITIYSFTGKAVKPAYASIGTGDGSDGNITVGSNIDCMTTDIATEVPNDDATADCFATYVNATSSSGGTTLNVNDTSGFHATSAPSSDYDEVMIVRILGASNQGQYELKTLTAKDATTLTVSTALANTYTFSSGTEETMVVRVPQYQGVTISAGFTLSVSAWSSTSHTGGVLAFRATNTVLINSTGYISASGKGFTGGIAGSSGSAGTALGGLGGTGGAGGTGTGTAGGGGGAGGTAGSGGNGSATAAGSGAGGSTGGGQGGSYAANGTNGTAGASSTGGVSGGDTPGGAGGIGSAGSGGVLYGTANLSTIFFGSGGGGGGGGAGGGGGDASATGGAGAIGGAGGTGGGIILIYANTITVSGGITNTGATGGSAGTPGIGGACGTVAAGGGGASGSGGGAGAGGAIFLRGGTLTLGALLVTAAAGAAGAAGGKGGSGGGCGTKGGGTSAKAGGGGGAISTTRGANASGGDAGPGGAGSAGRIHIEYINKGTSTTNPTADETLIPEKLLLLLPLAFILPKLVELLKARVRTQQSLKLSLANFKERYGLRKKRRSIKVSRGPPD